MVSNAIVHEFKKIVVYPFYLISSGSITILLGPLLSVPKDYIVDKIQAFFLAILKQILVWNHSARKSSNSTIEFYCIFYIQYNHLSKIHKIFRLFLKFIHKSIMEMGRGHTSVIQHTHIYQIVN